MKINNITKLLLPIILTLLLSACNSKSTQEETNNTTSQNPTTQTTEDASANGGAVTGGTTATGSTAGGSVTSANGGTVASGAGSSSGTDTATDSSGSVASTGGTNDNVTIGENNNTTTDDTTVGSGVDNNTTTDTGNDDNTTNGGSDDNTTSGSDDNSTSGNDDNSTTTPIITLKTLNVTISKTTLNKDETTTVKVEADYSDHSKKEVTDKVEWIVVPSDAVKVNSSTLTAKKDGNVTLQAKVGNKLSNVLKLNITWVVDVTPPAITLNGEANITLEQNAVYTEQGATALDAVDGNVAVIISGTVDTSTVGSYTVTYTAQDQAGNEANSTRSIRVIDVTPPVITLNGELTITLEQNAVYTELGATALDAVDGNVSVSISGMVDTSTIGNYTVMYTAQDSAGNEANLTRSVEVINTTPTLSSITLESNASTVNVGDKVQLLVVGTYSDGSSKSVGENITYIATPAENVEVNGSTLAAKKDGNVTLQAKVGNTLSNVLKLNIIWVVDGHTLPPEPDKATNDSTLLGVDVNDNGVRDDVERWIYETYDEYIPCHYEPYEETLPNGNTVTFGRKVCEDNPVPYHPAVRAVAMQGARAAQIIIQEPEKARETLKIWDDALDCASGLNELTDNSQRKLYKNYMYGDEFKQIQFNTISRARAFGEFNFNLSGGVYDLSTNDVILQGCSQEVHILLEDLK
jgi:hypothetical protein